MSRLEEIKNTAYYTREGDSATHDVEYLLSKLEIAEKALESANNKLSKIASKDFTNGQLRYEAATIIQEAIKQIRE